MTNPNIVDVATINGGSLGWNVPATLSSLITVAAQYILKINRITVANVDGTNGSWTFQEGADNLFLLNNITGKKYKINLTEI